jgi:hypothetical protein
MALMIKNLMIWGIAMFYVKSGVNSRNGGIRSMFFGKVGNHVPDYTVAQPTIVYICQLLKFTYFILI